MSTAASDGLRRPSLLVLCLLLIGWAVTGSAPASAHTKPSRPDCATTGSVDFGLDLAGTGWRFKTGDDPAWAAPGFDDSAWDAWTVPDDWGTVPALSNYDGFAWYRKTFTLPTRPAGITDAAIVAALGLIDDADRTFLNGQEIGRTGGFPPDFDSTWEVPREYFPADGVLNWGGTNVLAVRMYDGTGGGSFYKGPVGLFSKARLRSLAGMRGAAADRSQLAHACAVLDRQHAAVAAGDVRRYARTLARGFFHQGDIAARRRRELRDLRRHTYYFDAGEEDDFRFDDAARAMSAALTAKGIAHEWQIGPGRHADSYWMPKLDRSFGLHSAQFRAHPYRQPRERRRPSSRYDWP